MNVALDTNVLAYAEGVNGAAMKAAALDLVQKLPPDTTFVPVQALGELFDVLVRKAGRKPATARQALLAWSDAFDMIDTSPAVMHAAADLAADLAADHLGIWDSVIFAAAAEAGCRLLLSEDLQEGFTWRGVTVANPFAPAKHKLLEALLGGSAA